MKLIDILGLKNFRVFNDKEGFLEELSSINILTGANNSGKSSIVKALQMLNNSVKGNTYPFDLDLNQQQHLLGDFENILFNKDNRKIEITLPFLFLGIENLFISLSFVIPDSKNTYVAKLRSIEVFDKEDSGILFSFHYREVTNTEKEAYRKDYDEKFETYKKENELFKVSGENFPFNTSFSLEPDYNPILANIDWRINLGKLKSYLTVLNQFYSIYLKREERWDEKRLEEIDQNATKKKLFFIPTAVLKLFKKDLDIEKWNDFLDNTIGDKEEISGKAPVGEYDFEPVDYYPKPEIENILFYKSLEVLRENCDWEDGIDDFKKSVIEYCFQSSWDILIQRISAIKYISNIKEENARGYNSGSNSPFINLLKSYQADNVNSTFIEKYLKAFEIGSRIFVDYQPKYQLILVSIITMDGKKRELVDFGYGIKQIVLILIQVSVLAEKNRRIEQRYDDIYGDTDYVSYIPSLLIIEEPESNLHPKWQSLLADMLAEACRSFNIQMIIETHSEYLIRKFQTLVAIKEVKPEETKIFYLRSLDKVAEGKKQIESLFIEEDGSIDFNMFDDGFFDESYKLEFSLLNIQFFKNFEHLKNSHQENEDKIVGLQQNIDEFTSKADVTRYEDIIRRQFDIAKLLPISVTYLVSGQFLLEHINSNGDYSPVIIQYGRAIENELLGVFSTIDPSKKWAIATMQGSLEKFKTASPTLATCSASEYVQLQALMPSLFTSPANLEIELIQDLRVIRNSAGHSGQTKTREEAIDYIENANNFLVKWINEKR